MYKRQAEGSVVIKFDESRIALFLKGVFMGIAEVIPGISGGTIALILGVYEKLIDTINNFDLHLLKLLKNKELSLAWDYINGHFLLILLLGMITSIFILSSVLLFVMKEYPIIFNSFISALLLSSLFLEPLKPKITKSFFLGLTISFVLCSFLYLFPSRNIVELEAWYVFLSGFVAISALVVPGISGSFILLLLGSYAGILTALKDLDIAVISLFVVGAFFGLMTIVRVIKFLYEAYREILLATFFGLIVFCVPLIWVTQKVSISMGYIWEALFGAIFAVLLVQMINKFSRN